MKTKDLNIGKLNGEYSQARGKLHNFRKENPLETGESSASALSIEIQGPNTSLRDTVMELLTRSSGEILNLKRPPMTAFAKLEDPNKVNMLIVDFHALEEGNLEKKALELLAQITAFNRRLTDVSTEWKLDENPAKRRELLNSVSITPRLEEMDLEYLLDASGQTVSSFFKRSFLAALGAGQVLSHSEAGRGMARLLKSKPEMIDEMIKIGRNFGLSLERKQAQEMFMTSNVSTHLITEIFNHLLGRDVGVEASRLISDGIGKGLPVEGARLRAAMTLRQNLNYLAPQCKDYGLELNSMGLEAMIQAVQEATGVILGRFRSPGNLLSCLRKMTKGYLQAYVQEREDASDFTEMERSAESLLVQPMLLEFGPVLPAWGPVLAALAAKGQSNDKLQFALKNGPEAFMKALVHAMLVNELNVKNPIF